MAKLTLKPNPSFKATVAIYLAGGGTGDVEFIFKHRTRADLKQLMASVAEKEDAEILMMVAEGWDLEEPFNQENANVLCINYVGAGLAILETYVDELSRAKVKN
jgi:hypothetical protein